ncbi:cbb3-type cytochrome oxidase subunit 3 [Marinicella litoralis]|uniref:Cytochrome c oxidase cbb3-type subunit 4 n=1 Tax=Marinicella litoralis TaxID=644220 RepID=A0A4V3DIW2_9GAMM|nr:cbb3-type cytochrome c oxidase subunit 3 [Marinicella litoralis]TDR23831.1 cytochrome c oxidase cbb3-type subunit 4 [Marinicella litoralis]
MISGIYTGLMLVVFLGIVAWAWSRHNKATFEELSHMALKDDDQINHQSEQQTEEKSHE